jgi:hypothetical protein
MPSLHNFLIIRQSNSHPMLGGPKTPTNLYSQLHWHLEGKTILVGDISKLNTPFEYFSNGIILHSLGKAMEDCHPLDTSFSIWGGLFPPPMGTENTMAPLLCFHWSCWRTIYFSWNISLRWWATSPKLFSCP